ncbi:orotidine-5'-phosphate decarboxylase [Selenomonas dianae]|uniref:Orotidine 5'-phosphate decarboxylase n=1 Tax=Selenomonas dianae TaxID=135079 RepID=A0ABN0TAQ7_9FIRM|nr:orotidine-5'-phosphate decarboxylase [Selenomonas dianae]WLD81662.1 orotidine-5'-phosphate decarboxylase [Selenomonas dianae]
MADDRLIAALDVPTREEAERLVQQLGDSVSYYKVGMELFYALGGDIVTWLKAQEKKVFLDLKLHDIPNTVGNGLCSLLRLRPDILNVHTAGGLRMMKAARDALHAAAEEAGIPCPKLIGVTVLTSMDAEDWAGLGHTGTIAEAVLRRAQLARVAGLDGVVASPAETAEIRRICGKDFLIVTPGIRPVGISHDDQRRVMTPGEAIRVGASQIVVGRAIYAAEDPRMAAESILKEMEAV